MNYSKTCTKSLFSYCSWITHPCIEHIKLSEFKYFCIIDEISYFARVFQTPRSRLKYNKHSQAQPLCCANKIEKNTPIQPDIYTAIHHSSNTPQFGVIKTEKNSKIKTHRTSPNSVQCRVVEIDTISWRLSSIRSDERFNLSILVSRFPETLWGYVPIVRALKMSYKEVKCPSWFRTESPEASFGALRKIGPWRRFVNNKIELRTFSKIGWYGKRESMPVKY